MTYGAVGDGLTLAVPVYNERTTLRPAIERILKTEFPVELEVIVVDDGSTDGSLDEIADLASSGAVKVFRHPVNRGKGVAIATALAHASHDLFAVLDADLEYDPRDYVALLEPVLAGEAEIVFGTRTFGAHTAYSFWYVIGNRVISLWASFLFNAWLSDVETCFKLAPTSVWRSMTLTSRGFGIEAEVTARLLKAKHRIYEVPISYRARTRTEGKKLQWTDGLLALLILMRVRLVG